jgi:hypothetical protein
MADIYLCLGALVLFTIGFRLVKLGNPYKRGGGDPYTKRRKYRMLGWMLWTTAGTMVGLCLISQLNTDEPSTPGGAPAAINPEFASIHTVTTNQRIFPNLIHAPKLQADAFGVPSTSTNFPGSLTLSSIQPHQMSIGPSLLPSQFDHAAAPKRSSDFTVDPETEIAPATAPVPAPVLASTTAASPAPAVADESPSPTAPAEVKPPSPDTAPPIAPAKLKQLDAELAAADAIVSKNPSNVVGYLQRGNAYGNERKWDLSRADYLKALDLDPKCTTASFNMAELDFMQGHYDAARPGFLAIVNNTDFGDLAKYKVFLCDLFGGHEQVAARELAVFNQIGSEASYYFANVAWSLYHNKSSAAQSWWQSATQIFAPDKINLYAKPLIDLGYIKVAS